MRLTTKGRFAVTAMIDVAMHNGEGPVALAGVADRQKISLSYLEQLFGKLRRYGLVICGRRSPTSISDNAVSISREGIFGAWTSGKMGVSFRSPGCGAWLWIGGRHVCCNSPSESEAGKADALADGFARTVPLPAKES